MSRFTSIGILFSFFFTILFTSCETEIDIIAPQRDVTIIYGLLEANKTRHFIRINKAFVGEKAASELAQEPGINEYTDAELTAFVQELDGNDTSVVIQEWILNDTTITSKEEGEFYNEENKIYYFDTGLNPNNMYRIVALVNVEGEDPKRVSAVTGLIGRASSEGDLEQVFLTKPNLIGASSDPSQADRAEVEFVGPTDYTNAYDITWLSAQSGVSYTSYYRFYYTEVNKTTGERRRDSILFPIGSRRVDPNNTAPINFTINPEEFFITIDRVVDDIDTQSADFYRYASDTLQFFLEIADNDLATYIEVNRPATEIVQEQPEYTNVVNGIGIFASRLIVSTRSRQREFESGRVLRSRTLEELLYSKSVLPQNTYSTINKGFQLESGRCNDVTQNCR